MECRASWESPEQRSRFGFKMHNAGSSRNIQLRRSTALPLPLGEHIARSSNVSHSLLAGTVVPVGDRAGKYRSCYYLTKISVIEGWRHHRPVSAKWCIFP